MNPCSLLLDLMTIFSSSFLIQATPLDKEGQVLGRGRHPDVKPLPLQMMQMVTIVTTSTTKSVRAEPPSCLPGLPLPLWPLTLALTLPQIPASHLTLMTSPSAQAAPSAPPTHPSKEEEGEDEEANVCRGGREEEKASSSNSSLYMEEEEEEEERSVSPHSLI